MKTSARVLRTINKLRARADRDSHAMTADYADRLDAEARAMGYDKWSDFLRGAVRSGEAASITRLVTVGGIGGRHAFVDPAFAKALQDGEIDDEVQAYRHFVRTTIDAPGILMACSVAAGSWDGDLVRRREMSASLWTGRPGQDRLVQSVAELAAALAGILVKEAQRGISDLLPPLWRHRPPGVHALRDALLQSRAYEAMDGEDDAADAHSHAETWWRSLSKAIEDHHPLGLSSGARHLFKPHEDGMRRAVEDLLVDRLSAACDVAPAPPPPDASAVAMTRATFIDGMARRLAWRRSTTAEKERKAAEHELDQFLDQMGLRFGDHTWSWTTTMARQLADLA